MKKHSRRGPAILLLIAVVLGIGAYFGNRAWEQHLLKQKWADLQENETIHLRNQLDKALSSARYRARSMQDPEDFFTVYEVQTIPAGARVTLFYFFEPTILLTETAPFHRPITRGHYRLRAELAGYHTHEEEVALLSRAQGNYIRLKPLAPAGADAR